MKGDIFRTEELFWDMGKREVYSNMFMRIQTPDRELMGDRFWSNEDMTNYEISNSKGTLPFEGEDAEPMPDSLRVPPAKPE